MIFFCYEVNIFFNFMTVLKFTSKDKGSFKKKQYPSDQETHKNEDD